MCKPKLAKLISKEAVDRNCIYMYPYAAWKDGNFKEDI